MTHSNGTIIGNSPRMKRAVRLAQRFAKHSDPVLFVGATGTGKDLFARHLHAWSGRSGPFLDVNCGALPREIIDGILFGHRRGVFTGAIETAAGLIEEADGGTLFLDELCSLSPEGQVKLLRVLESGEIRRLGESKKRHVNFRLVCAVQPGIADRVRDGLFRLDLYQRIAGVVIELAPLAERDDDAVHLARGFAGDMSASLDGPAEELIGAYTWPGNVRELQAAMRRAAILVTGSVIDQTTMAEAIALGAPVFHASSGGNGVPSPDQAFRPDHGERERLLATCEAHAWRAEAIAKALDISRTTLFRRLSAYRISLRRKSM